MAYAYRIEWLFVAETLDGSYTCGLQTMTREEAWAEASRLSRLMAVPVRQVVYRRPRLS